MKLSTKLWIGLGGLAVLSPLGLILPEKFKAGDAWGEWDAEKIKEFVGYVPKGLQKLSSLWNAPLRDYTFKSWQNLGIKHVSLAYVVSAIIGIALCFGIVFLLGKFLLKNDRDAGSSKKADGFIERSILNAVGFIQATVSNDETAARHGFLQGRDPRFKSLGIVVLVCCVLVSKSVIALSGFYLTGIILALVSSISLGFFLKRTLLFVPLFSFFIVVPAIFSNISPGEPVFSFTVFSNHVSITRQGLGAALIFFMRVLASVSFAVLLVLTTRHHVLLKVLRIFKVPQVFVMTMGMCYRYIYLFLDTVQKTFLAIKSRVGFVSSTKAGQKITAMNMAGLWLKSYRMQTQVYDAMLSRGYSGEPKVLEEFKAGTIDGVLLTISLLTLAGTLWLNRFFR